MADKYVDVSHGSELPKGAIKAMHRGLDTSDQTCIDSYVALCTYKGEPCFGRSCLQNGRLTAWFPWGDKERISSNDVRSFKILIDDGRDNQKGFKYTWTRLDKIHRDGRYTPVQAGGYSPAVVGDVNFGGRRVGEMLGKTKVGGGAVWTSYDGKELVHSGRQYQECYVLCRKRVY